MTPNSPKSPIAPMKKGDKRIGSASFYNQLISTCNAIRRLKVYPGPRNEFILSDDNAALVLKGGTGGDPDGYGWHWAATKEWDYATAYAPDEVVMVSPGNANEFGEVATGSLIRAGIYVCTQATTASTIGHCPCWPLLNNDPDNAANYWIMLSLYPTMMTYCLDGVDTDYYVNAQPVTEPV